MSLPIGSELAESAEPNARRLSNDLAGKSQLPSVKPSCKQSPLSSHDKRAEMAPKKGKRSKSAYQKDGEANEVSSTM